MLLELEERGARGYGAKIVQGYARVPDMGLEIPCTAAAGP
jgi:hypothetical protein